MGGIARGHKGEEGQQVSSPDPVEQGRRPEAGTAEQAGLGLGLASGDLVCL